MATVKLIIRKNIKDQHGKVPVRIRLWHNGQIKEITLPGVRINPDDWDKQGQAVKGNKMLSLRLENKLMEYKQVLNKLAVLNLPIDLDEIHGIVTNNTPVDAKTHYLNFAVHKYIEEKILTDKSLAYGTKKNYNTLRKLLLKDYKRTKLTDIDGNFMVTFEDKLRKKELADWTIHSRLKCLKACVNHAYENRFIKKPDWRGFKLKRGKSKKEFLRPGELNLIRNHLKKIKVNTRDWHILSAFIFSAYGCGARIGDCLVFTYENISVETIDGIKKFRLSYQMRKTGKSISIVLNKTTTGLLENKKVGKKEMIFNLLPYKYLAAEKDELSKQIESRNAYINKRLKILAKRAGLKRDIHFHLSRHSFISNCLTLGISHMTIKEIAGLSLQVLENTYAKVIDESKTEALKLLDTI